MQRVQHSVSYPTTVATVATVAIVGAGFSGAMTAVNLLRQSAGRPLRVVLINRSGRTARGAAYGTASAEHLLNVPAGNMSALADDPDDFLRYCRWADPAVTPASFVRRQQYGGYLQALLDAAEHGAPAHTLLERWVGEVVDLQLGADGALSALYLADGRRVEAHHVVLAFGNFAPADPPCAAPGLCASARYVRDPWAAGALDGVGGGEPVLLLGSGLTAVDVSLALASRGHRAPVWVLSDHGLLPAAHREHRGRFDADATRALVQAMGYTVRRALRALRTAMREHTAAGGDWRDLMAAVRPAVPRLWQHWPPAERRRFIARLLPYWEAARHRCAPASHARFEALLTSGQVVPIAGRLVALRESRSGVEVEFRRRGGIRLERLQVAHVVNCTGPGSDLSRIDSRFVARLMARGWLVADPLRLGAEVDTAGALFDRQGVPSSQLHCVGPLLRARDWEAAAVPELRVQAQRMAAALLALHPGPTDRSASPAGLPAPAPPAPFPAAPRKSG